MADKRSDNRGSVEELQADYDQFLKTFEKPTQIYRLLSARHAVSPIFMHRNLSYMKPRGKRRNGRRREKFSVNSLLHSVKLDRSPMPNNGICSGGPLELTFTAFCDHIGLEISGSLPREAVIEVSLIKQGFGGQKANKAIRHSESLGLYSVPCRWRHGSTGEVLRKQTSKGLPLQSTLHIPLGLFSYSLPSGDGVHSQKLHFKLWFVNPDHINDLLVFDSIPFPDVGAVAGLMTLGKSSASSSSSSSTDPSPAKRHCVAGASSNTLLQTPETVKFHDPCVDAVDENGQPDLSTWKGMLTQTKAAQSKTAQTLLKKSRELRNLVMDDPPTKSGLVYSYARGKRGYMPANGSTTSSDDVPEEAALSPVQEVDVWKRVYTLELCVLDEYRQCVVGDGEYQLGMTLDMTLSGPCTGASTPVSTGVASETTSSASSESSFPTMAAAQNVRGQAVPSMNGSSWETLSCLENTPSLLEPIFKGPLLILQLNWPSGAPLFTPPAQLPAVRPPNSMEDQSADQDQDTVQPSSNRVVYNFIYNGGHSQQTESRNDKRCPWCFALCPCLYALLKHISLVHPRLSVALLQGQNISQIDVAVSDGYDLDHDGDMQELDIPHMPRNGTWRPCKRVTYSKVFVQRPMPVSNDLSEFRVGSIKAAKGSRMYFHCRTNGPILPAQADDDSEDEHCAEWMLEKTREMIDDFTDVNDGEKEMMKLWNVFIMQQRVHADKQIPDLCKGFVEETWQKISSSNLLNNFLLHIVSLHDYDLLSAAQVEGIITHYQALVHSSNSDKESAPSQQQQPVVKKDL